MRLFLMMDVAWTRHALWRGVTPLTYIARASTTPTDRIQRFGQRQRCDHQRARATGTRVGSRWRQRQTLALSLSPRNWTAQTSCFHTIVLFHSTSGWWHSENRTQQWSFFLVYCSIQTDMDHICPPRCQWCLRWRSMLLLVCILQAPFDNSAL